MECECLERNIYQIPISDLAIWIPVEDEEICLHLSSPDQIFHFRGMEDDGKVHYAEWDTEKEWYKYFSYTWITYLIPKEWKKRVDVFKKISS